MNEATMVVVQFETRMRSPRPTEIAAVEGVDMVLMGTTTSRHMGIAGTIRARARARRLRAHDRRLQEARQARGVGGLATRPKLAAEFVKMGARYVSTGTDLAFLMVESTARAKLAHEIALR